MPPMRSLFVGLASCAIVLFLTSDSRAGGPSKEAVEFNRDVRPILSNNCFVCHGPDEKLRKGKLRLDVEKEAKGDRGGYHLLVAGSLEKSELFRRLTTGDAREHMPPVKSGKKLNKAEIARGRRGIEQGAQWEDPWPRTQPKPRRVPAVTDKTWPANSVDYYILARL